MDWLSLIGGIGSLVGGLFAGDAQKNAASTQASAYLDAAARLTYRRPSGARASEALNG